MIDRCERDVRRAEEPDQEDDREQQPVSQVARPVEERDERDQRGAQRVRDEHRRARAEPGDDRAARDPEDRDRARSRPRGRCSSASREPVVERTNHGSATKVIAVPVLETASAATQRRQRVRPLQHRANIVRPYVFVKCGHAEGLRGPPRGAPPPDPRRRPPRLRPARLRGRDRRAALEDETGLSRGAIFSYFPNKWELFVALAHRGSARHRRALARAGIRGRRAPDRRGGPRVGRRLPRGRPPAAHQPGAPRAVARAQPRPPGADRASSCCSAERTGSSGTTSTLETVGQVHRRRARRARRASRRRLSRSTSRGRSSSCGPRSRRSSLTTWTNG